MECGLSAPRVRNRIRHSIFMPARAYLLTFSTYGTHLPGSEKGWVDAQRCIPGSPILASNPRRKAYWQAHLNESPWLLDGEARIYHPGSASVCVQPSPMA